MIKTERETIPIVAAVSSFSKSLSNSGNYFAIENKLLGSVIKRPVTIVAKKGVQ